MEATCESRSDGTFQTACTVLHSLLAGDFRNQFIDELIGSGGSAKAMKKLRSSMVLHSFETASRKFSLAKVVKTLDDRTRDEGFEIFHSWSHSEHSFSSESTPVLLVDHFNRMKKEDQDMRTCLSLLLDVYFFHVLALCSIRAWDDGRPQENFSKVTELLSLLQGLRGSGHQFVENAETLLVVAVSQYHPVDQAYDELIERIWTLDNRMQVRFALISSAVLGGHLRWGSRAMYSRDVVKMRADNVGDYPWLLYSLSTLMEEYARLRKCETGNGDRQEVVKGLLNGLGPDPWAFFQTPPPISLQSYADRHSELTKLFKKYVQDLTLDFVACQPSGEIYSPLAFHFNFPHNIMNAILMICLSEGSVEELSLNDLLVGAEADPSMVDRSIELVGKLMAFAGSSRDRVGPQGAKLIIYDPHVGLGYCNMVLSAMKKYLT